VEGKIRGKKGSYQGIASAMPPTRKNETASAAALAQNRSG
jgi:hypothetical protein